VQPDWFQKALDQAPEHHLVDIEGASIHYQRWNSPDPAANGLLLVHGHAAHAHWWDFIAPAFTGQFNVVALDMSGSGDSEHRDSYSATGFAREIIGIVEAAGLVLPTVVGHSFGGAMTRVAAWQHRDAFSGIVLVDSAVPGHKGSRQAPPMPKQKERYYPSEKEGMRRFRLRPPQPCENQYILDHIAATSLRATDRGYQFKYDSAVFAKMRHTEDFPAAADMVQELTIPVGMIYGERSRFFPQEVVTELEKVIPPALIRSVPNAHHHVFLDQPLAFIAALEDLLN